MSCRRPTLIAEGAGDREAVPLLFRRICGELGVFDASITGSKTKEVGDLRGLRQAGRLERIVQYALRDPEDDCVLIALDCDDDEPTAAAHELVSRISTLHLTKPVEVVLFTREYESIFLHEIDIIAATYPEYDWNLSNRPTLAPESIRDAKGTLSNLMGAGRAYKPTRDQAKFSSIVDLARLSAQSPSFNGLMTAVQRLLSM